MKTQIKEQDSKEPRILIEVQKGVVVNVYSDSPLGIVLLRDYDLKECEEDWNENKVTVVEHIVDSKEFRKLEIKE